MLETTPFYTTVDVVWPALYFSSSYWTWWVILAGLLIELPVVIWSFKLPLKKAIVADLLMNAASAVVGMVALAIAGIGWEISLALCSTNSSISGLSIQSPGPRPSSSPL
jgi:hypothetical protein